MCELCMINHQNKIKSHPEQRTKLKNKNHSTQDSRVVPHRGTNQAALWLTAQIRRDAVLSESYGRGYRYCVELAYVPILVCLFSPESDCRKKDGYSNKLLLTGLSLSEVVLTDCKWEKATGRGAPCKNAIQWTHLLTPHANQVQMRPNRLSFLYCRERKHGLMGVHVYACISEGSGDTT